MKLIFECETELGRCDADRVNGHFDDQAQDWIAFASTTVASSGAKGMLRIEQRCYLRSAQAPADVRDQDWIRPEMTLEPCQASSKETAHNMERLHQEFVQRARTELAGQSLLAETIVSPAADGACP